MLSERKPFTPRYLKIRGFRKSEKHMTVINQGILHFQYAQPSCVVQSATCLATDAHMTADPGVARSIPAQSTMLLHS